MPRLVSFLFLATVRIFQNQSSVNKHEQPSTSIEEKRVLRTTGGAKQVLLEYLLIEFQSAQGHLMLRATGEISRDLTYLIVCLDCDGFD